MTNLQKHNIFISNSDCFEFLKTIPNNSVDLVLTDPPYFIDGLGSDWDSTKVVKSQKKADVIGGMPVGMKFDRQQSTDFYLFSQKLFKEYFRILKPGGFAISFSQARLYHSQTFAADEVGFEIRDMLGWTYEGQAKAFTQEHFVKKNKNLSEKEKEKIIKELNGRKTPQLKPMIEPMVLAQKPKEGTFINNWIKYGVGLIDTSVSLNDKFPGNLFNVPKPTAKERGDANFHPTVKPVLLFETLIKIFTKEGAVVVDPFLGSGTAAIASFKTKRIFKGSELDGSYFAIILDRMGKIIKKFSIY